MAFRNHIITFLLLLIVQGSWSQSQVSGWVSNEIDEPLPFSRIKLQNIRTDSAYLQIADEFGRFEFHNLLADPYLFEVSCLYHLSRIDTLILIGDQEKIHVRLRDTSTLKTIDIYYDSPYASQSMKMVDGITLTNGKKTQRIDISKTDANTSVNNARELYAKVPGLNIWESDGGGLQLGIGARGLSPSRTAHFNTRQNGYDISADALGYPETYYTPPSEALASIDLIRGAASLQFGPQFGGMLNFTIKEPSLKPFHYEGAHTYGAYQLINTFNLVSGTLKKRFSYLAYYQHKQGNGWRENSGFNQEQAFAQLTYRLNEHAFIRVEQTYMTYLAQQAGGLTDALFAQDPRQSIRARNWFKVNWRITAAHFNWDISRASTLDIKGFKVNAERLALGNLEKISRVDDGKERQLIAGNFENWGTELRYLKRFPIGQQMKGIIAAGARYYQGQTSSVQSLGTAGSDPNFNFLNPGELDGSDYIFPSKNWAGFVESIWMLNRKFSVSGGLRYEFIQTAAEGSYREQIFHPLTGVLLFDSTYYESKLTKRDILLGGIGFSYRPNEKREVYGNIAQNYRGINFSDIRIVNPNQVVDPNIQDERGYNSDLGIRGKSKRGIFDFSLFFMHYANKIGVINEKINDYEFVRLRTNVGEAYSTGFELFAEQRLVKNDSCKNFFTLFGNVAGVYAKYSKNNATSLSGNWVELVPPITLKAGLRYQHGKFSESFLGTYVHRHFSDGTNAESDPNAIAGIIPSYYVLDFSFAYAATDHFGIKAGVNNFTNNKYFTRRATSYPGPGIIPSDGISFYFTLTLSL